LVKELRLSRVSTLEQANAFLDSYLPKYNASFAVKPLRKTNLHRPIPKYLNLDELFCIKEYRTIGNGFTFCWRNRLFLVKNPSITMKKQRVCVMEHFDGKITLKLKNNYLSFVEVTQKDIQDIEQDNKAAQKLIKKERIYYPPPKDHPWRRWVLSKKGNLIYA
jgi:hypothetical protein